MTTGVLGGVRVLDFGWVWAAPGASSPLADLGAQVIRVESRGRLEPNRLRSGDTGKAELGYEAFLMFRNLNRGKQSITINLKHPRGIALLRRLATRCDAVLENFSPGVLERLGLGYAHLSAENPRLVYLSMYGAGSDGPYGDMRAYAPVLSSLGGVESLIGYPGEGALGGLTFGYADGVSAATGAMLLLAGLVRARRTGRGCRIEFSQLEGVASLLGLPMAIAQAEGAPPGPAGPAGGGPEAPAGTFPAAGDDAWVAVSVGSDREWQGLCQAIGRADLAADPRLASPAGRRAARAELNQALAAWTRSLDPAAAAARLRTAGVPAYPVQDLAALRQDPQLAALGHRRTQEHPLAGPEEVIAMPWHLADTPLAPRGPAPILGADTHQVLADLLGLGPAEVADLERENVLY